jgi:hypothetical protein
MRGSTTPQNMLFTIYEEMHRINDALINDDLSIVNKIESALERMIDSAEMRNVSLNLSKINETIEDISEVLDTTQEYCTLNRILEGIEELREPMRIEERLKLATATMNKFDDYMKNVDKLNGMINEFKGYVGIARASLQEKKEMTECYRQEIADRENSLAIWKEFIINQLSLLDDSNTILNKKLDSILAILENRRESDSLL